MPPAAPTSPAFIQRYLKNRLERFQRWDEAEDNSDSHRNCDCKKQHARVEAHAGGARQSDGQMLECDASGPYSEQKSQAAARDSQQNTFSKQLPNQAAFSRAQRCAVAWNWRRQLGPQNRCVRPPVRRVRNGRLQQQ